MAGPPSLCRPSGTGRAVARLIPQVSELKRRRFPDSKEHDLVALNSRRAVLRSARALAPVSAVALLLVLTACGMRVQTTRPYTPADGINLDQGDVHVRNVMVLSRAKGEGYLSATIVSSTQDTLTGVTGTAIKADASEGAPITATVSAPVVLNPGTPVVLTDRQPLIVLSSPDLEAGLSATLVLQFSTAGEARVQVPILDANAPGYAAISPAPTLTPDPSG
jgi:hypothetical protein